MKVLLFTFCLLLLGCSSFRSLENGTQKEAQFLMEELKVAETPEEEQEVLSDLWELSSAGESEPSEPYVSLGLSVKDAEGKTGVNLLGDGVPPLEVTVFLSGEGWSEQVTFTPLKAENVYVLMQE